LENVVNSMFDDELLMWVENSITDHDLESHKQAFVKECDEMMSMVVAIPLRSIDFSAYGGIKIPRRMVDTVR
jgi:hypothetical protein